MNSEDIADFEDIVDCECEDGERPRGRISPAEELAGIAEPGYLEFPPVGVNFDLDIQGYGVGLFDAVDLHCVGCLGFEYRSGAAGEQDSTGAGDDEALNTVEDVAEVAAADAAAVAEYSEAANTGRGWKHEDSDGEHAAAHHGD